MKLDNLKNIIYVASICSLLYISPVLGQSMLSLYENKNQLKNK